MKVVVDEKYDLAEDDGDFLVDVWGFHFTTDSGNEDFVVAGIKTDEVWVVYTADGAADQIWYKDGSDEVNATATAGATFKLSLDTDVTITPLPLANETDVQVDYLTYSFPTLNSAGTAATETFTLGAKMENDFFGTSDEAEANDFNGTIGGDSITGETDLDGGFVMMDYGAYFVNPENQFDSADTFEITVPVEQQQVTVLIKSKGSTVSAGSEGGMSYSVNPIALGLGVLDTGATFGTKPMIVVGGPNANTAAAELMGNPTPEVIAETFQEGKGIIKYYDDKQAMLVAGWGAQDTQGAAYVLAKYDLHSTEFVGNELEIVVTDLENIEVNAIE